MLLFVVISCGENIGIRAAPDYTSFADNSPFIGDLLSWLLRRPERRKPKHDSSRAPRRVASICPAEKGNDESSDSLRRLVHLVRALLAFGTARAGFISTHLDRVHTAPPDWRIVERGTGTHPSNLVSSGARPGMAPAAAHRASGLLSGGR